MHRICMVKTYQKQHETIQNWETHLFMNGTCLIKNKNNLMQINQVCNVTIAASQFLLKLE